ncbi:hypothetical protein [Atopobacter phocae]
MCNYDEFTVNGPLNQMIKTTVNILLQSSISIHRKK